MKLKIGLVLTAALFVLLQGCDKPKNRDREIKGSWVVAEKKIALGNIKHLEVYSPGDVYITMGDEPKLRIEADDNILPYLIIQERDGKLIIRSNYSCKISGQSSPPELTLTDEEIDNINRATFYPRRRIKYYLTVTNLETIITCGEGNVTVPDLKGEIITIVNGASNFSIGKITAKEVKINPVLIDGFHLYGYRGRGRMNIESVFAEKLELQVNNNLDVNISGGEVQKQKITINNEGNYIASEVKSVEADVLVTGEGSVTIRVSDKLNVNLSDYSGNVYYMGNPEIKEKRRSDLSGEIIKIQE